MIQYTYTVVFVEIILIHCYLFTTGKVAYFVRDTPYV